ncbi:MAG TPA: hypothetical protein VE242_12110 [Chthoniobacterales bacterium]|nr:hypothetical protein [Chthoniobacterales bacterium]
MDTVRFAKVVEACGKPDTHLLLIDPAKDKTLQAAIKSNRVMTVHQHPGSAKTDYGTIGFEQGVSRQFLLFPKTLNPFDDKRVIGIKYDLLESVPILTKGEEPKQVADQARKPTAKTPDRIGDKTLTQISDEAPKVISKSEVGKKKRTAKVDAPRAEGTGKAPPEKLVEFPKSEAIAEVSGHRDELQQLKRRAREAMDLLEQGKQVAAFNLLKQIVEE